LKTDAQQKRLGVVLSFSITSTPANGLSMSASLASADEANTSLIGASRVRRDYNAG